MKDQAASEKKLSRDIQHTGTLYFEKYRSKLGSWHADVGYEQKRGIDLFKSHTFHPAMCFFLVAEPQDDAYTSLRTNRASRYMNHHSYFNIKLHFFPARKYYSVSSMNSL